MARTLALILLVVLNINNLKASYEVNERCKNAWLLIVDLELDSARSLLRLERQLNPENYYAIYLEQTCDAYDFYINGTVEDYYLFLDNYELRRDIMDNKDEESPYYLACDAEMQMQAGLFNILEGDEFSGLRKMYSGYKKTYRNLDDHPGFPMSKRMDGFFNVAIGNLPPFIKKAVSFFGVSSNPEKGFEILNQVYEEQKDIAGVNAQAALYLVYAAKINKTPDMVYSILQTLPSDISKTYVIEYFKANVAYRTGHNEEALTILNEMDSNKNYLTRLTSDYLMGKVLMRKLEDSATYYLNRYIDNHNKEEYLKEINYYLALNYLFKGDDIGYNDKKQIIINEGMEMQERDREALYDVSVDYPPNINLIKVKLLADGAYLKEAAEILNNIDSIKFDYPGHQLEYFFLRGRLAEIDENYDNAISHYNKVLNQGEKMKYSLASESALRLGIVYDKLNMPKKADHYYSTCLKLYNSNYYEYIEDKARKASAD